MLDDLLGRTELKQRIEELEGECDSLRNQLDAESERRSDAVRDRQAAEERVNELETQVEELEHRLERADDDEADGDVDFRGRANLTRDRRDRTLDLLASLDAGRESVLSAYVADDSPEAVREAFGERAPLVDRAAPCVVVRDREGVVSAALRPPNPPEAFCEWSEHARIQREWFAPTGRYAFAVVRADVFALGVYEADGDESGNGGVERVYYEGFESDVKGDHSKGGFSQRRFERRRDSQIAEHVQKCQEALAEVDADRLFVAGQETLLDEFDADATAAVDATGKPEAALGHAHDDFWTVPLFLV
jgi:peptide subunit release factor 1 (eRF1)